MSKTGKGKEADKGEAGIAEPRTADKAIAFAKRHPVMMVAGAIAIGAVASTFVPRKASRRLLGKALSLAEATGAVGLLARKDAGTKAERANEAAMRQLEKYGLAALSAAGALGKATASRAEKIGDVASDTGRRAKAIAQDVRARITH